MPGAKKPKIKVKKPYIRQVQVDPNYADKTWNLLRTSIEHIHNQNASGLSFEELYRNAYTMVLHKHGDLLYNGVKDTVRKHLKSVVDSISQVPDSEFLSAILRAWKDHKTSQLMIRDILMYMNSVYVRFNNVPDTVAREPQVKRRLLEQLLDLIARERRGEVVNRSFLKRATEMLVELGCGTRDVYAQDFEKTFLVTTRRVLRDEAASRLATDGAPAYLAHAERRLGEELARVTQCLDKSTEARLRAVAEEELLAEHMQTLIGMDSGLVSMLKLKKYEDLRRMHSLFARLADGHTEMRNVVKEYLKSVGMEIVSEQGEGGGKGGGGDGGKGGGVSPATYVEKLLELRSESDQWLTQAFGNGKLFQVACTQAFEHFINASPKSPEYLSLFVDEKLRKGLKGATEQEVEQSLESAMSLFRYVHEKDVFEKYYKQHLARRLLFANSVSDDAERQMISKLKAEVGFQFTSKLEGMFTDVRVSRETNERFREYRATLKESAAEAERIKSRGLLVLDGDKEQGGSGDPLAVDIDVHVLTTGFWPMQKVPLCTLPSDVAAAGALFRRYYLDNHSGRRLAYQANMGTADVRAAFAAKKHELSVSTFQMVLLCQFNDKKIITAGELAERTSISARDMWRSLASLCSPKHRILLRKRAPAAEGAPAPAKGQLNDKDMFGLNVKFKSKLFKIRVSNQAQSTKEDPAELKKTRQKVEEDRKHLIDAALVRIMKNAKQLSHNELIAECTKLLTRKFVPSIMHIKSRIESLIEREYLERDNDAPGGRRGYKYLA